MNKKFNTAIFLIAATFFNIIVMLILFFIGTILIALIPIHQLSESVRSVVSLILSLLLFAGVTVGSFMVYRGLTTLLARKYNFHEYLTPYFQNSMKKYLQNPKTPE